jgi:drug/metabolite transporter (DMT)-like permease
MTKVAHAPAHAPVHKGLGIAAALAAITIYAGMFFLVRHGAANGLDRFDRTALRFVVSTLIVTPFVRARVRAILSYLGWVKILVLITLQGAIYSCVFLGALTYAPAVYAATGVPGLQPFVVTGLSLVVLGQKPRWLGFGALTLCLMGCALMTLSPGTGEAQKPHAGIMPVLSSALMWGSYSFVLRHWQVSPVGALLVVGVSSGPLYLPPYFWAVGLDALNAPLSTISLQAVYQGLGLGVLAVLLFAGAVQRIGSTAVASLTPAMPVMAVLIALLALGEVPSTLRWIGSTLVTIGPAATQSARFFAARMAPWGCVAQIL